MKKKSKRLHNNLRALALKLVKDPRFLYRLVRKMGELGSVGESRNCLVLFLAGLTKGFEKPVSVLIKGNSSTGKSESVKAVIALFPPKSVLMRASLSKMAPVHGSAELKGKILYIAEYRGAHDAMYLTRLLQSEGEINHEYTTVVGRARGTAIARRKGIPVVFSTTTH